MAHSLDLSVRMTRITGAPGGRHEPFAKTLVHASSAVVLTRPRTDQTVFLRVQIGGVPG